MTIRAWREHKVISQKGTGRTSLRKLLPGEQVPDWAPVVLNRHRNCVELRWRVGPKLVVFTYASKVLNGRVNGGVTFEYLKPGDPVPDFKPKRYMDSSGYVRLRWRVGRGRYVETREHRVENGFVTLAKEVHHKNWKKNDNSKANLVGCKTSSEHGVFHRRIDRDAVSALYQSGLSTTQVGRVVGCNPGQVSRILKCLGVQARKKGF